MELFISDLDGTLLNGNAEVTVHKRHFEQAHGKGT